MKNNVRGDRKEVHVIFSFYSNFSTFPERGNDSDINDYCCEKSLRDEGALERIPGNDDGERNNGWIHDYTFGSRILHIGINDHDDRSRNRVISSVVVSLKSFFFSPLLSDSHLSSFFESLLQDFLFLLCICCFNQNVQITS